MKKITKIMTIAICLFFLASSPVIGNGTSITLSWDQPTHYADGDNCLAETKEIEIDQSLDLRYQIQWRLESESTWQNIPNATSPYVITSLPYGAQVELRVWSYFEGETPHCFEELVANTPVRPAPGGCKNIKAVVGY